MRKLALSATVVCLMSCLTVSAFGGPEVTVVNPASLPVPMNGSVTVVNPSTQPVPVTDVNTPGFQPWESLIGAPWPTYGSYTVPVGKILVIEDVNARFAIDVPVNPELRIEVVGGGVRHYSAPAAVQAAANVYQYFIQASPRFHVGAGRTLHISWFPYSTGTIGHMSGEGAISGHLINAP